MRLRGCLAWVVLIWCIRCAGAANLGYVTVGPYGPDDGSDYGPYTPGTQTSGIQEAINAAVSSGRDVYVLGGSISSMTKTSSGGFEIVQEAVYHLHQTLYFPPASNFRFTGGNSVFNFTQSATNPLVRIDSQSGADLRLPLIVGGNAQTTTALVLVAPRNSLPDGSVQFIASRLSCQAIVGGGNVFGDAQGHGNGLVLQSSQGDIIGNEFYVSEIIACETGIHVSGTKRIEHNTLQCVFNHLNNYGVRVFAGQNNEYRQSTEATPAIPSIGVQALGGSFNTYELMTESGGHQPGSDLQIGPMATDNTIMPLHLPNGMAQSNPLRNWMVRLVPM